MDSGATTLGVIWRHPNFPDQSWPTGRGLFSIDPTEDVLGVGAIHTPLRRYTNGVSGGQINTYYFRTRFEFSGVAAETFLLVTNVVDDGAVFYLNNIEVARLGMPASPPAITAATMATRDGEISGYGPEAIAIPGVNLVQGTNLLAVELHQGSPVSADAVFGLTLQAMPLSEPIILTQPQGRTAVVGGTANLSVDVIGKALLSYQWYKDGNPLANFTNKTFNLTNAAFSDAGDYTLRITNLLGSATSQVAVIQISSGPLLGWASSWRYNALGHDLGITWRDFEFEDSTWPAGQGVFGQEIPACRKLNPDRVAPRRYYLLLSDPLCVELPATLDAFDVYNLIDDGAVL